MDEPRTVTLPSGATLRINVAPFADSKALYQSILKELRSIAVTATTELAATFKDLFCAGFSSPIVEACLWKCMARCTYNNLKIDDQTFEPIAARDDYIMVCKEVAQDNILPFVKSLYAEYQAISAAHGNSRA